MTSSLPKLRSDLRVSEQPSAGGTAYVLKQPATREFYRLKEVEYFIAQQLDGATSLDVVRQRAQEKFGLPVAEENLTAFVNHLEKAGLLGGEGSEPRKQRRRQRRVQGSLLYLRCRLFDPDKLFNWLVGKVRFCFAWQFQTLSAFLILAGVGITALHLPGITQELAGLYRMSTIPLLLGIVFLVITLHEFGHGLTCKHYGGEVHELGFMLLYFQPALYCNVSDAWLFPEKSKRLLVGVAGPYIELLVWGASALVWRITETETWVHSLALVVLTTSGVKTLFNFNPLIKYDGYYLLSDLLDMPNLRKRSSQYVGQRIKWLLGFAADGVETLSRRDRRIYLTYGLVASVFSFSFLGYLAVVTGTFLIERDQALAFLGFSGLVGSRFQRKLRKLFARSTPDSAPRAHGSRGSLGRRAVFILACVSGLAFVAFGRMELRIAGPFSARPIHNADVRARVDGLIEEIVVDEGDFVEKGQLMARLSDREYRADLQKVQAELGQTQARLKMLKAGPRPEDIEVARSVVVTAKDRLRFVKERLERDRTLYNQGLLSKNDFETTAEQEANVENELAEASQKLNALLAGSRSEEIEAAEAEISRLLAQHRFLEQQIQHAQVLSPANGVITTPSRQLKEMSRRWVKQGDLIAKVHELNTILAEIQIPEKEIADVEIGQKVAVKARAFPDATLYGKVTSIATAIQGGASSSGLPPSGSSNANSDAGRTILVTTEIENPSLLLKPDMTGHAKIYCGERSVLSLITRRIARTVKVEFWSWW